jgi:hypothetical protein
MWDYFINVSGSAKFNQFINVKIILKKTSFRILLINHNIFKIKRKKHKDSERERERERVRQKIKQGNKSKHNFEILLVRNKF